MDTLVRKWGRWEPGTSITADRDEARANSGTVLVNASRLELLSNDGYLAVAQSPSPKPQAEEPAAKKPRNSGKKQLPAEADSGAAAEGPPAAAASKEEPDGA